MFTIVCGEPGEPRGTPPALLAEVRGVRCEQDSFSVRLDGLRRGATYECAVAASGPRGNSTVSGAAYVVAGFTPAATESEGGGLVWSHEVAAARDNEGEGSWGADWGPAGLSPASAQDAATGELLEQATTALGSLCAPPLSGPQAPPEGLQVKRGAAANTLVLSWFYCTDLAESFDVSCQALGGAGGTPWGTARQTLSAMCWESELEFALPVPPPPAAFGAVTPAPWGCEVRAVGPRGESEPARATTADEAGLFDPSVLKEAGTGYCDFARAMADADGPDEGWDVPVDPEGLEEVVLPGAALRLVEAGRFDGGARSQSLPPASDRIFVDLGGGAPLPGGGGGAPGCTDEPPPGSQHSCAEQRGWGKCGERFLRGYCRRSCGRC